jgi:hypothetical protein
MRGLIQVGSFGAAALPIVLSIQHEPASFHAALYELAVRLRERFVLLSPTGKFYDARAQELLGNAKSGFFDLETNLVLTSAGRLQANRTGGQLFARLLPEKGEPLKVTEGKRIFGLFMKLATERTIKKAPLEPVFRLVVLEGHSQAKAARLCGCVPALISRRVRTIESRFEMSIEQLRNFASDILEMEATVKADRYGKRKRGASRDEPAQDDGGRGRAELVEDDDGYLPEERPDSGE